MLSMIHCLRCIFCLWFGSFPGSNVTEMTTRIRVFPKLGWHSGPSWKLPRHFGPSLLAQFLWLRMDFSRVSVPLLRCRNRWLAGSRKMYQAAGTTTKRRWEYTNA